VEESPKPSSSKKTASTPSSASTKARSTLHIPSPKSSSSSAGAATLNVSSPALTAVNKQGKTFKVNIILEGEIFSPTTAPALTLSASAPGTTGSTRKRTRTATASITNNTTTTTITTITPSNEVLVETMTTPPSTPSSGPKPTITKTSESSTPLGHDGNVYSCFVCSGFGDVICCDGCPNVCHRRCVSKEHPSRISLENDEDPWLCPACHDSNKKPVRSGKSSGSSRKKSGKHPNKNARQRANSESSGKSPSPRTCIECDRAGGKLEQCQICQEWMHHPSCKHQNKTGEEDATPKKEGTLTFLCSKCREDGGASPPDNKNMEEDEPVDMEEPSSTTTPEKQGSSETKILASSSKKKKKRKRLPVEEEKEEPPLDKSTRRRTRSASNEDDLTAQEDDASSTSIMDHSSVVAVASQKSPDQDEEDDENEGGDETNATTKDDDDSQSVDEPVKKRLPPTASPSTAVAAATGSPEKKGKKNAKKKKKKKKKPQPEGEPPLEDDATDDGDIRPFYGPGSSMLMAKATPAFYFFLAENRLKIERNLSRKHRYFNRLPKGYDRNEIVAKEAAGLWVKLRPSEVRRYMNMSMRDFEQRTVEWKEEKNIRDMLTETDIDGEDGDIELSAEDEAWTHQNHERLYLGTTVGSKPFKPEPDESHNRVLLELLQDMRFHPVPMFIANRTETEYGQMDFARITIPYFDVHGPVSTSVGDECLGCTRGWTHYCSVLKRKMPAVEHRAKLQPPLSSLVATRVGLGMRPRPQEVTEEKDEGTKSKDAPVFAKREVEEAKDAKNLPWVPWESLKNPSERADDIVQFVEEAVSMKVPEPPRPGDAIPQPEKDNANAKKSMISRAILPTSKGRKRPSIDSQDSGEEFCSVINKCGRCRTVIQTDTGCIQCRRAQLVINMSKREGHWGNGKSSAKGPLKVQTYMLGRINMKEGSGEIQSDGDQAIANGILRQMWAPFVVLPPRTLDAPTPQPKRNREESDDEIVDVELSTVNNEPAKGPNADKPIQPARDDARIENGDGSDESNSKTSSKRMRSARIGAQVPSSDPLDDADRQLLAQRYKEEADELHKKGLSVACCGILLALMRRDPLLLFAVPVAAEGYSTIIKNPIDFEKIRSSVLAGKYVTLGSFVSDARLLCTNALAYNPPGSIYWKTAKELYDVLAVMQKRASNWMGAVKDSHACAWRRAPKTRLGAGVSEEDQVQQTPPDEFFVEDPFEGLRKKWPEAVEMLENGDWLRQCIKADFMRTKENETAYYGSLASRRAAVAAEASLAPYPDTSGIFSPVGTRNHVEDEHLRRTIDERVSEVIDPVELKDLPTWREESIVRVMRRAQSRRLEGLIGSVNGCARCDGMRVDQELKMAMTAEAVRWGRTRRKNHEVSRVHVSRVDLSTGLSSQNTMKRINKEHAPDPSVAEGRPSRAVAAAAKSNGDSKTTSIGIGATPPDVAVSVRGSRVHGWGLFADQPFQAGDVVAEYIGEYVSLAVTEAREKAYQEQRIQDYQFRLDDQLVIDATMRGGHGRYINHNCSPNCIAKIIPGPAQNEHLKRVIIIAHRDIEPREELTYDYQFPLELDLEARIPCNCHSEHCRGFMNWDLPEKGANNRVFRTQKRGANMRDRIRRLGRPLKSEK
jgi:hypothetical protein